MESRKIRERKKKKGEVSEEQKVTLPMVRMDRNATSDISLLTTWTRCENTYVWC